jgi:hypothetical protein
MRDDAIRPTTVGPERSRNTISGVSPFWSARRHINNRQLARHGELVRSVRPRISIFDLSWRREFLQWFRNASPRQCRSHLLHSVDQLDRCRRRQNKTTGWIPAAGNRRIGSHLIDPTNAKLDSKRLSVKDHTVDRIREGLQALRSVNILKFWRLGRRRPRCGLFHGPRLHLPTHNTQCEKLTTRSSALSRG